MSNKTKKSVKAAPVVKHTKTSLYRMIKANPLLLLDNTTNKFRSDIDQLDLPDSVLLYSASTSARNNKEENKVVAQKPKLKNCDRTNLTGKSSNHQSSTRINQMQNQRTTTKHGKTEKSNRTNQPTISKETQKNEITPHNFKTAAAYNRRSAKLCKTSTMNYKNMYNSTLHINELQKKLDAWLHKEDKSVSSYHHLKQFGSNEIDDENKENVEPDPPILYNSNEELNIKKYFPTLEDTKQTEVDLNFVAHDALTDLYKLILDGYPKDQCEIWLRMIKEKCIDIENDPEFWECKAAIEQYNGNTTMALKCVENVAIKGAQINNNDSLEQLLHKFDLLNINTEIYHTSNMHINTLATKSTIIQFAIKEDLKSKNKEDNELKFIATPVRRSTRMSRSAYVSTPKVQICSSLKTLTPQVRKSINFRKNDAILD